jgi:hypothetical protein
MQDFSDLRIALVVPTIREASFRRFVEEWGKIGLFEHVYLILVEDNPKRTFELASCFPAGIGDKSRFVGGHHGRHYSWEDIETDLKEKSWIVPRRSDTVRSYGYWLAWDLKFDYALTLDDDCYPPTAERDGYEYPTARVFLEEHLRALRGREKWFNSLPKVRPRGVPYKDRGELEGVVVNHGLWTNVLDYDAPAQLVDPQPEELPFDSRLVPRDMYFPMCGMNVMWRTDVTPLMYHLLMGSRVESFLDGTPMLRRLPFDRLGDIWCGILMKRIADVRGLSVSTGMPYIRHDRASDPFVNLVKEAPGIRVNERFWRHVDAWVPNVTGGETLTQRLAYDYRQLGDHVGKYAEFPEHVEYFKELGAAMRDWADLFLTQPKEEK